MYSRELLRLALRLAEQGRLDRCDGSAERRSRSCGSVVIADVTMNGVQVASYGHHVLACAIGQASAAILCGMIAGLTRDEVAQARTAFADYLSGLRDDPGNWPELRALSAVREHKGRHAAALLPYDAALAAIDEALSRS